MGIMVNHDELLRPASTSLRTVPIEKKGERKSVPD